MKEVAKIIVETDGKRIYLKLHPQGDEASGDNIVTALRDLADAIDFKVELLKFSTA